MFGQRDNKASSNATESTGAPMVPAADTSTPPQVDYSSAYGAPSAALPSFSGSSMQPAVAAAAPTPVTYAPPTPIESVPIADTTEDLARMKQEALQHLQPLVDTLQQSPEEEFRTIMMMIQATDDKSMLKKALESAKRILDDKVRAQAMLDVINEINYFTQTAQD